MITRPPSSPKELRTKQTSIINRGNGDVLTALNAALADPAKAYQQAMEAVELQGQPVPTSKSVPFLCP